MRPLFSVLLPVLLGTSTPALLATPQAPVFELDALGAPGAATGDRLGDTLALNGDWLASGVPERDGALPNDGALVIWPRLPGGGFGAPEELTSPAPTSGGRFGRDVALGGADELFVSEERFMVPGAPSLGAVHLFARQGNAWVHAAAVGNPGSNNNGFGRSIAFDGDFLVVGAPLQNALGSVGGAVYVFERSGLAFGLVATLDAGATGSGFQDQFGASVAVADGRVLVGAPRRIDSGTFRGAAFFFEESGGAWSEVARFMPAASSGDFGSGVSVALSGDTGVVGAARTNDVGAVYHFERSGGVWSEVDRLQPDNLGGFATFGHSVDLLGDHLVVGAYQDTAARQLAGSAWTFERVGGVFEPRARLVQDGPPAFHGFSVALDGAGHFVVGEPIGAPAGGLSTTGVLRHYRPVQAVGANYCAAVPNSTGLRGQITALGSAAVSAADVTLVAHDLPVNAFGFFVTSQTQGLVNQPGGSQGVLCLGGGIGRYVAPGQVVSTGLLRTFSLTLDLNETPTPNAFVAVTAGQTWNFQAWHRDLVQGAQSSNFTDAVSMTFVP